MTVPLDVLACPADGGSLAPETSGVRCQSCNREYPLVSGVLCMLPDELRQESEPQAPAWQAKRAERQARDHQADRYDRMLGLRLLTCLERPRVLRALSPDPQALVLDAGCGTGRITLALARRCRLLAVDFSLASLVRCRSKLEQAGLSATLVQADLNHLPVAPGTLDGVVSCQVLEHLPSAESRAGALAGWRRALRPGGRLAATAYHYNWATRWFGAKEGCHPGGIFYHRFTLGEYAELIGQHFALARVRPLGGYVLLAEASRPRED